MSHRIHFLIFTGLSLMFCSCRKENRFEWQVNQRHMEVSLNKESDSLYVIHLNTDQPSHFGNCLIQSISLIMEMLQETGCRKSLWGLSSLPDSIPNLTSGYSFTGLQMKRISAHFG